MSVSTSRSPRGIRIEAILVIAFWALILMLNVGRRIIDPRGPTGPTAPELWQPALEYMLWALLTPFVFWLSSRVSVDRKDWFLPALIHVLMAIGIAMVGRLFCPIHVWFASARPGTPFGCAG